MSRPFVILCCLAGLLASTNGVHAQQFEVSDGPMIVCELPVTAESAAHDQHAIPYTFRYGGQATATFEVEYNDFPPEARDAFQAAIDIWSQHIVSSVPIKIEANWQELSSPSALGAAGPFLIRGFAGAPVANTWYPAALANAIAGKDLDPSQPDILANFNSEFVDWYFGTDGNPPDNQFDLTTIVLHEIGHGLGFIGSFNVANNIGTSGVNGAPFIFDRHAEDEIGQSLLNSAIYPGEQLALVLRGGPNGAFFGGESVVATNEGSALLYSPASWSEGTSFSHYDEVTFPRTEENGLMTPFIVRAEVHRSPGPLTCAAVQDLGWTLAQPCAALVSEPSDPPDDPPVEPPDTTEPFVLSLMGENPFTTSTDLSLTVSETQQVVVFVVDRLGRRVATLLDGVVEADTFNLITFQPNGLASGVYFIRAVGEGFDAVRAVTVIR